MEKDFSADWTYEPGAKKRSENEPREDQRQKCTKYFFFNKISVKIININKFVTEAESELVTLKKTEPKLKGAKGHLKVAKQSLKLTNEQLKLK